MTALEQHPPVSDSPQVAHLNRENLRLKRMVVVLAIGLIGAGFLAVMRSGQSGSVEDEIEVTQQIADELAVAVEAADPRGIGEFFAENALYEDPAAGMAVRGRSAIEATFGAFLSPEEPIENTAVFVGPGFAVTEFAWNQRCTFVACSPEMFGEPVEVRGIILHLVEDGEVIRETDYIAYPRNLVLP